MTLELGSAAAWFGAVIAAGSAVTAIVAYYAARTEHRSEMNRKIRKETLDSLSSCNAKMTQLWLKLDPKRKFQAPDGDSTQLLEELAKDDELYCLVFEVLDGMQLLSVGLIQRNYDTQTFTLAMGDWIPKMVARLDPYIEEMRKRHGQTYYAALTHVSNHLIQRDKEERTSKGERSFPAIEG